MFSLEILRSKPRRIRDTTIDTTIDTTM
jgi:hypothetical protein